MVFLSYEKAQLLHLKQSLAQILDGIQTTDAGELILGSHSEANAGKEFLSFLKTKLALYFLTENIILFFEAENIFNGCTIIGKSKLLRKWRLKFGLGYNIIRNFYGKRVKLNFKFI